MANETKIPLFRRFVIQNFPFIEQDFDALTDYQLISKIVEYLNQVITSQNNLVDDMNDLVTAFNTLKDYVDHYFDNLDVQEEINNKLDAMAEAGTLEEIMADYLDTRAVFGFDTVADLKNADNLTNGSFARTLGYYAKNDGGAALFKIRTITNDDVVNETTIYEMLNDNTLIAELIIDDSMNVKQFGVKADGTTDNTAKLNIILGLPRKALYFPNGEYVVNTALDIASFSDIKGESKKNTIIKAPNGFLSWSGSKNNLKLSDFTVDGVSVNSNTGLACNMSFSTIENVQIKNYANGINFVGNSYIDKFDSLYINNCTTAITGGNGVFNNNTFYNCYFQHNTNGISCSGYNINIIGCNFEFNTICFPSWGEYNISDSYFESNDNIIKISASSYNSMFVIEKCWLNAPTNVTGWLADLPSFSSVDNRTAALIVQNSHITLNSTNHNVPFAFNSVNGGTKTYWGISLYNNVYRNMLPNDTSVIYYDYLVDTTNAPQYGTNANPTSWGTDLPVYNYQGIVVFRESMGNMSASSRNNFKCHLTGRYAIEQTTGGLVTITPDKKYHGITTQIDNLVCFVQYTDNSYEIARFSVDAGKIYVYMPAYNSRTTRHIEFNATYYIKYGQALS